eukprot:TRINITY_DN27920_c1_g1_i1.p1 TRINITY_DN27920_c1_g1~~TRINITY_DN27920_c1_g1_i1.p1  ORF type:complete len:349 (-),score=92.20 TRINITY_DN27920_c1_g1_i1:185-1231(-)
MPRRLQLIVGDDGWVTIQGDAAAATTRLHAWDDEQRHRRWQDHWRWQGDSQSYTRRWRWRSDRQEWQRQDTVENADVVARVDRQGDWHGGHEREGRAVQEAKTEATEDKDTTRELRQRIAKLEGIVDYLEKDRRKETDERKKDELDGSCNAKRFRQLEDAVENLKTKVVLQDTRPISDITEEIATIEKLEVNLDSLLGTYGKDADEMSNRLTHTEKLQHELGKTTAHLLATMSKPEEVFHDTQASLQKQMTNVDAKMHQLSKIAEHSFEMTANFEANFEAKTKDAKGDAQKLSNEQRHLNREFDEILQRVLRLECIANVDADDHEDADADFDVSARMKKRREGRGSQR